MNSHFDFVTAGRIMIGLGALMFLMALAEFLGWISHVQRRTGWHQMLWGLGLVLYGVRKLSQTSWEDPNGWVGWAAMVLIGVSAVMSIASLISSRKAPRSSGDAL
jgi:uncharacterized membrane protein YuzA (DUF378 family)